MDIALKSSILSSIRFQLDNTFWGLESAGFNRSSQNGTRKIRPQRLTPESIQYKNRYFLRYFVPVSRKILCQIILEKSSLKNPNQWRLIYIFQRITRLLISETEPSSFFSSVVRLLSRQQQRLQPPFHIPLLAIGSLLCQPTTAAGHG